MAMETKRQGGAGSALPEEAPVAWRAEEGGATDGDDADDLGDRDGEPADEEGVGEKESPAEEPAAERIARLMKDMGVFKKQLLAIVDFCREERTSEEVDEMLAPMQAWRQSVYSPVTMRSLLERAGALACREDGDAPEEGRDAEGNLVLPERGGFVWRSTDEGLGYLAAQDPSGELEQALGENGQAEVYTLILDLCDGEGCKISEIERIVGESGLLEDSARQTGFFVGRLEDLDALEWHGSWSTTETGRRFLEGRR